MVCVSDRVLAEVECVWGREGGGGEGRGEGMEFMIGGDVLPVY